MRKYLLFDLDGTLVDTGEGIMRSVQYAVDALGLGEQPQALLRRFVGPPLHLSFQEFFHLTPAQADLAVEKYRERYREKGVFESPLYPGVYEALAKLSQRHTLCLATSKPLVFARQILELRNIDGFFTHQVGANLDGTMTDKAQVIQEVLRLLGKPDPKDCLMVGDRLHDVKGATAWSIDTVGVEYGFAQPGELKEAGAAFLFSSPAQLEQLGEIP